MTAGRGDFGDDVTFQELPGRIPLAHHQPQPGLLFWPYEVSLKALLLGSRSEIKTHFFQGLISVQFHRLHLIDSMQREDQGLRHVNRQLVKALDLGGLGI